MGLFTDARKQRCDELSRRIIGAAIEVPSALGPGLLESAYERCLSRELQLRGMDHRRQVPLKVGYKGVRLEDAYRLDCLVGDAVVLEVKSVDAIHPVRLSQVRTYLRLQRCWLGIVLDFNVERMKDRVLRVVN